MRIISKLKSGWTAFFPGERAKQEATENPEKVSGDTVKISQAEVSSPVLAPEQVWNRAKELLVETGRRNHGIHRDDRENVMQEFKRTHQKDQLSQDILEFADSAPFLAIVGAFHKELTPKQRVLIALSFVSGPRSLVGSDKLPIAASKNILKRAASEFNAPEILEHIEDDSPQNLRAVSHELLRSNDVNRGTVLLQSATLLAKDSYSELKDGHSSEKQAFMTQIYRYDLGSYFIGKPYAENFEKDRVANWDKFLEDLGSFQEIKSGPQLSPSRVRAGAHLRAGSYHQGIEMISGLVGGVMGEMIANHQSSVDNFPGWDEGDQFMAKSILKNVAKATEHSDSVRAASQVGMDVLNEVSGGKAAAKLEPLVDLMQAKGLTSSENLLAQELKGTEHGDSYLMASLASVRPNESPASALLRVAGWATATDEGIDHKLLERFGQMTGSPVEKALVSLALDRTESTRENRYQASLSTGLHYAQGLESAERDQFLKRLGLRLLGRAPRRLGRQKQREALLGLLSPQEKTRFSEELKKEKYYTISSTLVKEGGDYRASFYQHFARAYREQAVESKQARDHSPYGIRRLIGEPYGAYDLYSQQEWSSQEMQAVRRGLVPNKVHSQRAAELLAFHVACAPYCQKDSLQKSVSFHDDTCSFQQFGSAVQVSPEVLKGVIEKSVEPSEVVQMARGGLAASAASESPFSLSLVDGKLHLFQIEELSSQEPPKFSLERNEQASASDELRSEARLQMVSKPVDMQPDDLRRLSELEDRSQGQELLYLGMEELNSSRFWVNGGGHGAFFRGMLLALREEFSSVPEALDLASKLVAKSSYEGDPFVEQAQSAYAKLKEEWGQ